jgi:hypothetical protein
MGRALITSHVGAGLYNATLLLARGRIAAQLADIAENIISKEAEIAQLNLELNDRIDEIVAEQSSLDTFIEQGEDASGTLPPLVYDADIFIGLHNSERTAAGKPTLAKNSTLMAVAQTHADYLKAADLITHQANGLNASERAAAAGFVGSAIAENLNGGDPGQIDVIDRWTGLSNTRSKILSDAYTSIGVGFSYEGNRTYGYYWVAMYGGP